MFLENYFFIFIIGAIIGSFINVCIYRLPKNLNIVWDRSSCPRCKKKIKWFDNIPIFSFIILKLKCRYCKKPISVQYFLIEFISALFLCSVFAIVPNYIDIFLLSIVFYIFIIIFMIDIKHYIIPDSLNFSLILIGIFKNFLPETTLNLNQDMLQSFIGGALGYLIIWIIIILYKKIRDVEAMGLGDAKLLSGLGFLFGMQSIFFIIFIAAILGLVFSVPKLLTKKSSLKSAIPFGPFLIAASVIYYFSYLL